MGLMDILNGMQNGPRGAPQQSPVAGGGMPTWMMAVLGLLAYKAVKGGGFGNLLGGNAQSGATQSSPLGNGGIGDIVGSILGGRGNTRPASTGSGSGLGGLLGGLLAGGAAGSLLNGGLRNLIGDMQQNGQGNAAQSWIGTGPNDHLAPDDLAKALGSDDINQLSSQVGVPRDQLLSDLSNHLPEFVNRLTPDGQMPSDSDASQWV
jgi:uncharacterized protein YidB (DUF937 family)